MSLRNKWLTAVEKKNSVLCAGLDPAEFTMGRGENGLAAKVSKRDWALKYIEAVAPYAAAVKPNLQYWKGAGDMATLEAIADKAHSLDMIVIDDSKLADIGSTNDAGMFYGSKRADAVTFSPFAGNIAEAAKQAKERGLGVISMCLMSNPEFKREKNILVPLPLEELTNYPKDILNVGATTHKGEVCMPRYIQLAHDARVAGMDGVVVGAPSAKNHIQEHELMNVAKCIDYGMLVLVPGVGKQGGDVKDLRKAFAGGQMIINVGRALMLPRGSNSTREDHIEAAKHYQNLFNEMGNAS